MGWVYVLECADGSYYVGSTRDIDARVRQHADGTGARYTRSRRPVRLAWTAECADVAEAFWLEKKIQNWSRKKREALIRGDFEALPALAKKDFTKRRRDDGAS